MPTAKVNPEPREAVPDPVRTSFVLIPGAGGMAWYWHPVVRLLREAQQEAIAVNLPGDDESAGLDEYAEIVLQAIGDRRDVVLVAQSLGGFTAPLVCERTTAVRRLVFVNAMLPEPEETAGAWWDNTGATAARIVAAQSGGYGTEFDLQTYFLHDVPADVLSSGPRPQNEADIVFGQPCRFRAWPQIPIHVIASDGDRFFPVEFQRRIARERLNVDVDTVPGGHLVALSHPEPLVALLLELATRVQ